MLDASSNFYFTHLWGTQVWRLVCPYIEMKCIHIYVVTVDDEQVQNASVPAGDAVTPRRLSLQEEIYHGTVILTSARPAKPQQQFIVSLPFSTFNV